MTRWTNNPKQANPDYRELDILVHIANTCTVSFWESGFCQSTINTLKTADWRRLTPKQKAVVGRMIAKYKIKAADVSEATPETIDEALLNLRNTGGNKPTQAPAPATPRPASSFDDLDDDIPF